MTLTVSVSVLIFAIVLFVFCRWRETRPRQIGEIRHVPYSMIMILCLTVVLVVSAHILSLLIGQPLPGSNGGF